MSYTKLRAETAKSPSNLFLSGQITVFKELTYLNNMWPFQRVYWPPVEARERRTWEESIDRIHPRSRGEKAPCPTDELSDPSGASALLEGSS